MTFEIWLKWMEPSSSLQSTWDFFYKIKKSIACLLVCLWNSYPRSYVVQNWKPSTYATCYLIDCCQIVVTLCEIHFILSWSRPRTLHTYLPTSTLEVAQEHFTHPSILSHKIKLHVIHDYPLQVIIPRKKDMGNSKRNERHAQKSMIKK